MRKHGGPDAVGDVVGDGSQACDLDAVFLHDRPQNVDQALRVRYRRRSFARAVQGNRLEPREVPLALRVQPCLPLSVWLKAVTRACHGSRRYSKAIQ